MFRILQEGRNCGAIARAARAAVLVDAANYFLQLESALLRARRSILIIGWDFDGGICLSGSPDDGRELGLLLRRLVETHSALEVHILIWSLSLLHAPGNVAAKLFGAAWQDHPRLRLRLDRQHPLYGCHHQKIVVIDDSLAFVGGIDLTVGRRDNVGHAPHARKRRNPDGRAYGPVHDIQMLVEGEAAARIGDLARHRWRRATLEALPPPSPAKGYWPADLRPDFQDLPIGICRTAPAWRGAKGAGEGAALALDMFRAARRWLYVEAQYFTADFLFDCLAPLLAREKGPEIVLVLTASWHGQIERFVLSRNRDRLLRRLKLADRFHRLRAFHPQVPDGEGGCPVLVHAKLMIADDRILRVGSSNLNNRSTGLDTECDLAIEAATAEQVSAIAALRNRLLAEHMGVRPRLVAERVAQTGSLIAAIDALNRGPRRLTPFEIEAEGPVRPVFGTGLIDPPRPYRLRTFGLPLPRPLRSA